MDEIFGAMESGADSKLSGSKFQNVPRSAAEPDPVPLAPAVPVVPAAPDPNPIADPVAEPDIAFSVADASEAAIDVPATVDEKPASVGASPLAAGRRAGPSKRVARFGLAFLVAGAAVLLMMVAAAAAMRAEYSDRVVPGVRVGSVDVSGMTRDEVIAELNSAYGYLSKGQVTVKTASGTSTINYDNTGRAPDSAAMADEALRVGHSGDPIADTVAMVQTSLHGETVPLSVKLDPIAVAKQVRALVSTNTRPVNASASVTGSGFTLNHASDGKGIDEVAISEAIVDHLGAPDQGDSFSAGGAFIMLEPEVTDAEAQAAIDSAQKMVADVQLVYDPPTEATAAPGSGSPSPTATSTPAPSGSGGPSATKSYSIDKATVLTWISFGFDAHGKYTASLDVAKIQATVSSMNMNVTRAPVEPTVTFDASGKPNGVTGGAPGAGLDTGATAQAIASYVDGLSTGGANAPVEIVTAPVQPDLTPDSLTMMQIIGQWTTTFYPDISNGYGANIRQPAKVFNGQVVAPGAQFDFLQRVGPIDPAHGFALGGVIVHGKSDHTGAMGGGICSASTTMFNAAANAGLQIDERHNHAYYINRYPIGLDATVFSNGWQTYDMKWTNDTSNYIVVHSTSTKGSKSTITVQLWSLPTGRTTTFSPAYQANVIKATDSKEYTSKLSPGQTARAEYPTDGFDTSRTRTVTDGTGKVIHQDTWKSHYVVVDGILEIGIKPGATPPGGGTPAPTVIVMLPFAGALIRRRTELLGDAGLID